MTKIKIVSWNINGLRSLKGDLKTLLDELQADIICLQETKLTRDLLDEELALVEGYNSFFSFSRKRSGYSGVATYCKKECTPSYAQEGLGGIFGVGSLKQDRDSADLLRYLWGKRSLRHLDSEGRCVITQHPFIDENGTQKILSVVNVYCPRADPDRPDRPDFKLSFYHLLKERARLLTKKGMHVVIVGDVNTAHKRIDHCDPEDNEDFEMRKDRIFLDDFITATPELIEDCIDDSNASHYKVVDTFRHFHPLQAEAFTCWNTMVNARATNYGTRIDYALCDKGFLTYTKDSLIHPDVMGSDHCPVSVEISGIRMLSSNDVPEMCTKFYPEFHGTQRKLSSYFNANSSTGSTSRKIYTPQNKRKVDDKSGCFNANSSTSRKMNRPTPQNKGKVDDKSGCFNANSSTGSTNNKMNTQYKRKVDEVDGNSGKMDKNLDKFGKDKTKKQATLTSFFKKTVSKGVQFDDSDSNSNSSFGSACATLSQGSSGCTNENNSAVGTSDLNNVPSNDFNCEITKTNSFNSDFNCNSSGTGNSNGNSSSTGISNGNSSGTVNSNGNSSSTVNSNGNSSSTSNSNNSIGNSNDTGNANGNSSANSYHDSNLKTPIHTDLKPSQAHNKSGWNFMMKTPEPPPVCSGHKEPSVLRTVKKIGPNLNKQFYACAKGVGKEGDPNSRCNFFKWVERKAKV